MSTFAKNLKRLRKEVRITQEQAARELGVSHGTWCKYEQGSQQPMLDKLPLIAAVLGSTVAALTKGM